ncbi:hypothetical protein AB1286_07765 [Trinickia sp. NRRL B-1857]|uniref:hypothetical protein n=1 Tax=Trinickia sp. NRRL B-1857 TaxID=3162879 RepID=UPI003D2BF479
MATASSLSLDKFLSMLEKAVRPQFFLLAASFLFFSDSMLAYFSGASIKDIIIEGGKFDISLALEVALIFVAFSGLVSLILPTLKVTVVLIYIEMQYQTWKITSHIKRDWIGIDEPPFKFHRREHNRVRPAELLDEAHEKESKFLMDRYEQYERDERESEIALREMQAYSFCSLTFILLNYLLPENHSNHTLTNWVVNYCGTSSPVWMTIGVLGWLVVLPVHQDDFSKKWIYCPPLYKKLEAAEEERRKIEQEWTRRRG